MADQTKKIFEDLKKGMEIPTTDEDRGTTLSEMIKSLPDDQVTFSNNLEETKGYEQEVNFNPEFNPEKAEQIRKSKETFEDVIRQFKKDHPFTPGPKIQLGAIPKDISCDDATPGS
jgi:hypothetical protein